MYSSLIEANNIIEGERQDTYGRPEDSFEIIASFWNTYLTAKGYQPAWQLNANDVAMMMTLLKIARETQQHKRDNAVDAIGYLAIYADKLHKGGGI